MYACSLSCGDAEALGAREYPPSRGAAKSPETQKTRTADKTNLFMVFLLSAKKLLGYV
jgi:hypothetical protein